jgi:hypothetical protein
MDRRINEKTINSAPHHLADAHNQPPRGEEENVKAAPTALYTFPHTQKKAINTTPVLQNMSVPTGQPKARVPISHWHALN